MYFTLHRITCTLFSTQKLSAWGPRKNMHIKRIPGTSHLPIRQPCLPDSQPIHLRPRVCFKLRNWTSTEPTSVAQAAALIVAAHFHLRDVCKSSSDALARGAAISGRPPLGRVARGLVPGISPR